MNTRQLGEMNYKNYIHIPIALTNASAPKFRDTRPCWINGKVVSIWAWLATFHGFTDQNQSDPMTEQGLPMSAT